VPLSLRNSDHRTIALMDGIAAFWLVFWLVVAGLTGQQIWSLSRLSDTAEVSAAAVDQAGEALQRLSEIPLVSDGPGELGDEVRSAAADIADSAAATRENVHRLSILLGVSIFLIPSSPVLGLYLPLRLNHRRDVAALRKRVAADRDDTALQAYLAHRALGSMTYVDLLRVTADPARDVAQGHHASLARAELARLGLSRSAR
jgi:hypothetical protein